MISACLVAWAVLFEIVPTRIFQYDYAVWRAKFDLMKLPSSMDVVIVGDSATMSGVDPSRLRQSAINLSLACGGPVEAERIYDHYRKTHAPPKVLVISFAQYYYHSLECLPKFALAYDFFSLAERARILANFEESPERLPLYESSEDALSKLGVPSRIRHLTYLALLALHLAPQQVAASRAVLEFDLAPQYESDYETTFRQRGHFVIGQLPAWAQLRTEGFEFDEFRTNPIVIASLEALIRRAQMEGAKVILRSIPLNPVTTANFSTVHREQYSKFFHSLIARHLGLVSTTAIREWPPEAFGDGELHLNAHGAELESADLAESLEREFPR